MGTQYHIKVVVDNETDLVFKELDQFIKQRLIDINQKMSTYIEDSELSLFNQLPVSSGWKSVSKELFDVITLSQTISETSNGVFDITIGPLVNLWGFGPNKVQNIPSDQAIQSAKEKIGYTNLLLKDNDEVSIDKIKQNAIKKTSDIYVDLSAIAKGYACDLLAQDFKQLGFEHFMVEIGGEIFVSGLNASSKSWTIGVEKPSMIHAGALQAVGISNVGVATSGDYRNYYEIDGVRASHTINPTTGRPINHRLVSVTVVAENAAKADAYATAINVLGEQDGFNFAIENKLAVYFIVHANKDYDIKFTPEFEKYMVQ